MITVVVFLSSLLLVWGSTSSIDLNFCRLTHLGTEYSGTLSVTAGNETCQSWSLVQKKVDLHCAYVSFQVKCMESIGNEDFPDGSRASAQNYCRNPTKNPKGPWCYTNQKKATYGLCNVPLCKSTECRMSGPGVEYAGSVEKSSSGEKCMKWKEPRKFKKKHRNAFIKGRFFPDESTGKAGQKCRNPDGDIAGPWCYVERKGSFLHSKELCDIPFCDDIALIMYSEGSVSGKYFFFSSINESQFFNISFRLWDPADWMEGELYLYLSAYDIALERKDIETWNSGVEIVISNSGSGIVTEEEDSFTKTPKIVSGAKWVDVMVTWTQSGNHTLTIEVHKTSKHRPLATTEILIPNSIFEVQSFRYYSLSGSASLWNIPANSEGCSVHTTSALNFTRFWLIKKATLGKDIEIFVRAKSNAVVLLRTAPMNETSQIQIIIGDKNKIRVQTFNDKDQPRQLAESPLAKALDFWNWKQFKISLFKDKLQLFLIEQSNCHLLIQATHENVEKVMWVTFASPRVSYWTLYCDPRGIDDPPAASPPECVFQQSDPFSGTLSITDSGRQCLPWTITSIPKKFQNDTLFMPYGGKPFCQNFCRNLNCDPNGAYCFVRDETVNSGLRMEYCHPRPCSLGDCKLAGTASDYTGQLNITRSKRHCRSWSEIDEYKIEAKYFPDSTLEDAGNFCRNPTKSISGSWCFTEDLRVPRDLCFIRDCDKPLECTALTSGFVQGSFIYILPAWRKNGLSIWLKAWNPDIYEGLVISLISMDHTQEYRLLMGDDDCEKVKLLYVDPTSDECTEQLLIQKTLPHLIPTGKWKGYWLRPGFGKIELGYQGTPTPFFEWSASDENLAFEPMFLNFGTIKNHWIGVNFDCNECLTTETTVDTGHKIFPINLWRDEAITSNLHLNLRGTGSAFINLMWTDDFQKLFGIQIMSNVSNILILQYNQDEPEIIAVFSVSSTMCEHEWSEYILSFTEDSLTLHKDGTHMLEWKSPFPLLFYWFSVTSDGGKVTWTANCPASDIDGEPRDGSWGKWGPWTCSVTCGKGQGRVQRACDDPPPNVYGRECKGTAVYEGPCNDFPCGKISPDTNNVIRHYLSSQHKSLQVDVLDKVVLTCNSQAISLISKEVSEMNISWTHNGFPYSRTKFHMDENYSLVIHRAQEKHNGIYLCMAYQEPDSILPKVVLEVISLVVIKPKPKKIRKGKSLTLKCNGLALSYVYADLSQRWELNGTVWKDYGLGSLEAFTVDKLENVTDSHAGIWTCVIIQEDFKFKWTTNWIYLRVKSAPSFWSHLMEEVTTSPFFSKIINERNAMIMCFAFVVATFAFMILLILLFLKWLVKLIFRRKKK